MTRQVYPPENRLRLGHVNIAAGQLATLCRKYHIQRLSLFGSVLRDDFRPDSDIDLLIEFEPGHTPDFFTLYTLEEDFSGLFGGRPLDIVTPRALNPHLRASVLQSAEIIYAHE